MTDRISNALFSALREQPGSVSHTQTDIRSAENRILPANRTEVQKMKCEDLQFELPLYIDNVLDENTRLCIEDHLPSCPLCRQRLSEFGEIRNNLRQLTNPPVPGNVRASLTNVIAGNERVLGPISYPGSPTGYRERLLHWLMPLSAGAVGSLALAVLFLSFLFVRPGVGFFETSSAAPGTIEMASRQYPEDGRDGKDYLRIGIPENSPEVNPAGALIALTRSIVRGKMSDEEVVVVADVFGNGIANISEIVDPPNDEAGMRELRKAFDTKPGEAPFLPARMPRNSDAVRVVLRIQRVDVTE